MWLVGRFGSTEAGLDILESWWCSYVSYTKKEKRGRNVGSGVISRHMKLGGYLLLQSCNVRRTVYLDIRTYVSKSNAS